MADGVAAGAGAAAAPMPKASIKAAFTMLSAVHEPKIKSDADGLYLENAKTKLEAYAAYMKPSMDGGNLLVRCVLPTGNGRFVR